MELATWICMRRKMTNTHPLRGMDRRWRVKNSGTLALFYTIQFAVGAGFKPPQRGQAGRVRKGDFGVFSLFFWKLDFHFLDFSDLQIFLSKTPFSPSLTLPVHPFLFFYYKFNFLI